MLIICINEFPDQILFKKFHDVRYFENTQYWKYEY